MAQTLPQCKDTWRNKRFLGDLRAVHYLSCLKGTLRLIFLLSEKNWEFLDSNPGLLNERRERFLCAKSLDDRKIFLFIFKLKFFDFPSTFDVRENIRWNLWHATYFHLNRKKIHFSLFLTHTRTNFLSLSSIFALAFSKFISLAFNSHHFSDTLFAHTCSSSLTLSLSLSLFLSSIITPNDSFYRHAFPLSLFSNACVNMSIYISYLSLTFSGNSFYLSLNLSVSLSLSSKDNCSLKHFSRLLLIYLIFNEFIEHPTSRTSHMFVGFKLSVMRAVYLPWLSGSVLPATSISFFLPFTLNQLQYFRVMTRALVCSVFMKSTIPCK